MSEEDQRKQKLSEEDLGKVSGGNGADKKIQPQDLEKSIDEDEDVVLQRHGAGSGKPKPSK